MLMIAFVLTAFAVAVGCDRNEVADTNEQTADEQTAVDEPSGQCPEDGQLSAVFEHDDTPVVAHDVITYEGVDDARRIDGEEADELGRPHTEKPYWLFPRDGGAACRMEPGEPMLIPVLYLEPWNRVVLASQLDGDCGHLDEDELPSGMPDRPVFAVQAESMPEDCRLDIQRLTTVERDEGNKLPDEILELRNRLEVDDPFECDSDAPDCTLHWQLRQQQLDDDRRLIIAEVVQVQPFPEDSHVQCLYDVQHQWSSGVVLEEDGQLRKLHRAAWPVVLQLGAKGEGTSLLGLTNDQTRLLSWVVDDDGVAGEKSEYQWWEYHEEEMTSEIGLYARFICGP